jgi:hypothetical protein
MLTNEYRKPSRSAGQTGCMYVRWNGTHVLVVNPANPTIEPQRYTPEEWRAAQDAFRRGEFDLPPGV